MIVPFIIASYMLFLFYSVFGLRQHLRPWHPYIQKAWNVWVESSTSNPLLWELPQSRLHLRESLPKGDPSLEMLKTTPTGCLNCPPRDKLVVSHSYFLISSLRVWKATGSISIHSKHGLFLYQFDLVWFGLLCQWRGLLCPKTFSQCFWNNEWREVGILKRGLNSQRRASETVWTRLLVVRNTSIHTDMVSTKNQEIFNPCDCRHMSKIKLSLRPRREPIAWWLGKEKLRYLDSESDFWQILLEAVIVFKNSKSSRLC